ncbi:MAG: type I restriction enzyme HsdR N-terminal domain-containing protein [Bacteroidia bacterium]|nr:type I restriction enzyme HsdR N-terminal domain-containing protein [Bacteroidia bacterium]
MSYIKRGKKDKHIHINEKKDQIIYLSQGKERKWSNPEEKVQAETYLKLIYDYKYPPEYLRVCQKVQIGSSTREGDVMVYKDKDAKDPFIVVECKKKKVGNSVFEMAIDQGFSYAAVTNAEYVWATSGDKNAMFEVDHSNINERVKNRIPELPRFRQKFRRGDRNFGKWLFQNPIISDTLLYGIVLLLMTLILSKVAVEFNDQWNELSDKTWTKWNWRWDYNWYYNIILAVSSTLTLLLGMVFMRSHEFFRTTIAKKWLTLFLIGLILIIPSWYVGVNQDNLTLTKVFDWWSFVNYQSYASKGYPIMIYLWPYLKSWPVQMLLIAALIWLMNRK